MNEKMVEIETNMKCDLWMEERSLHMADVNRIDIMAIYFFLFGDYFFLAFSVLFQFSDERKQTKLNK